MRLANTGKKRTPEQVKRMCETRKTIVIDYTIALRQKMSDSHLGKTQNSEQIEKKRQSLKITNDAKIAAKIASGEYKCHAPNCDSLAIGKQGIKYKEFRYCIKHGARLKTHGSFNRGKPGGFKLGHKSSRRHEFTPEQIEIMMDKSRSICSLSREFGVTEKVIVRVHRENNK